MKWLQSSIFAFITGFWLITAPAVAAAGFSAEIIVFVREGCQHCKDEEAFLGALQLSRSDFTLTYKRLENPEDRQHWDQLTTRLGISKVTPITVVGDSYIIGFESAETTGSLILSVLDRAKTNKTVTNLDNPILAPAGLESTACPDDGSAPCEVNTKPKYTIRLPILGPVETSRYPLVALAALLGFIDGFNPCAMWVLVTFLVILLQIGDRKKMIQFAGTFIFAEAVIYSLIMTIWYKTWDFVQLDGVITPIVGVISIIGGIFFLKSWHRKELECKVTNVEERSRTHKKITELATNKFTLATFLGILGVAFSVNIIEFACSIGIPQAFTKILELNNLPPVQSIGLIGTYILFYMIDDFLVFGLALYGADRLHLTGKYSRYSNLIGGIIMIILGLLLILKPQALLFQ